MFSHFDNLLLDRKVVAMSLKATGVDYKTDKIVQFAFLSITPDDVPRVFAADVNPGIPIPAAATAVHGIGDKDVAQSRSFSEYAEEIWDYLDDAVLVGYNIKKFTLPLLIQEFRRCGREFPLHRRFVIDALQIFGEMEPRDLSAALSFYCGQKQERADGPDQDVDAIALLLDSQLGRYPKLPGTITELHDQFATPDILGLFRYDDDGLVFTFGKYCDQRLREVSKTDPEYLRWMLESGEFLEDVQDIVKYSLGLTYCE